MRAQSHKIASRVKIKLIHIHHIIIESILDRKVHFPILSVISSCTRSRQKPTKMKIKKKKIHKHIKHEAWLTFYFKWLSSKGTREAYHKFIWRFFLFAKLREPNRKKKQQKIYHIKVMATALHKDTYIINSTVHNWLVCIVKRNTTHIYQYNSTPLVVIPTHGSHSFIHPSS